MHEKRTSEGMFDGYTTVDINLRMATSHSGACLKFKMGKELEGMYVGVGGRTGGTVDHWTVTAGQKVPLGSGIGLEENILELRSENSTRLACLESASEQQVGRHIRHPKMQISGISDASHHAVRACYEESELKVLSQCDNSKVERYGVDDLVFGSGYPSSVIWS